MSVELLKTKRYIFQTVTTRYGSYSKLSNRKFMARLEVLLHARTCLSIESSVRALIEPLKNAILWNTTLSHLKSILYNVNASMLRSSLSV